MYFAVIREQGPSWDSSQAMREQEQWPEHVNFINGVAEEGFLLLAGPLGAGNPYRAMLIVDAEGEVEVANRIAGDPWTAAGVLETRAIDRWEVLVGEFAAE